MTANLVFKKPSFLVQALFFSTHYALGPECWMSSWTILPRLDPVFKFIGFAPSVTAIKIFDARRAKY